MYYGKYDPSAFAAYNTIEKHLRLHWHIRVGGG